MKAVCGDYVASQGALAIPDDRQDLKVEFKHLCLGTVVSDQVVPLLPAMNKIPMMASEVNYGGKSAGRR